MFSFGANTKQSDIINGASQLGNSMTLKNNKIEKLLMM